MIYLFELSASYSSVINCRQSVGLHSHFLCLNKYIQEAQLMLTNPRDAFRGQSIKVIKHIPFHM